MAFIVLPSSYHCCLMTYPTLELWSRSSFEIWCEANYTLFGLLFLVIWHPKTFLLYTVETLCRYLVHNNFIGFCKSATVVSSWFWCLFYGWKWKKKSTKLPLDRLTWSECEYKDMVEFISVILINNMNTFSKKH